MIEKLFDVLPVLALGTELACLFFVSTHGTFVGFNPFTIECDNLLSLFDGLFPRLR